MEFGKYLAHSCVGCHGGSFQGGPIPGGDPNWPEATNIRLGADSTWTKEKFFQMIETGVSAKTAEPLRAPMPIALLKQMNETEKEALWAFLSTLN